MKSIREPARRLSPPRQSFLSAPALALYLLSSGALVRAQALPSPAESGPWYKQVQVDVFVSASFSYNFNRPASGFNAYRVFDFDEGRAKLDLASLTLQKAAAKPGEFGFRVDMGAGSSQPEMTAARGLFRNVETGAADHFDVEQAYVSYVANAGRGLRFDVGKFYAPIGYESVERYDAYNDNATHSFLFGYSAPYTTTGLKITYPFSDRWSGMVMVVQGWDNVSDNNTAKSVGAQITCTPGSASTYVLNYIGGPEQTGNNSNWRSVYDFCATWMPTSALTLGLNADYGHETEALGPGRNGTWYGAAGYLVYAFKDRFQLALRAERFDDRDGARTGVAQRLDEVTLTPTCRIGKRFVIRGDVRVDWSDKRPFEEDHHFTGRQPTLMLNVIFVY